MMMITHTRAVSANGSNQTIRAISHPAMMPRRNTVVTGGVSASVPSADIAARVSVVKMSVRPLASAKRNAPTRFAASSRDPQPRHVLEHQRIAAAQHRQDHGQRVLGEQLLASEHDDEKPDA